MKGIFFYNFLVDRKNYFNFICVLIRAEYSLLRDIFGSFSFALKVINIRGPPLIDLDLKNLN